jgi:hypothetical protein
VFAGWQLMEVHPPAEPRSIAIVPFHAPTALPT